MKANIAFRIVEFSQRAGTEGEGEDEAEEVTGWSSKDIRSMAVSLLYHSREWAFSMCYAWQKERGEQDGWS